MGEGERMATRMMFRFYTLIFIMFLQLGLSYEFYEELYDYEGARDPPQPEAKSRIPQFTSQSLNVTARVGDNVRLPCIVDTLQGFVLIWKRGGETIALGSTIIDQKRNNYGLELEENGNHLVVHRITEDDEGIFMCQVSVVTPVLLHHHVYIRRAPVIRTVPSEHILVQSGDQVSLRCEVLSGYPYPSLTWKLPRLSTVYTIKGPGEILISRAAKSDTGDYVCEASNGFSSSPVYKMVTLQVHYAPEVDILEISRYKHGAPRTELVCTVDSVPAAVVQWVHNMGATHSTTILPFKQQQTGDTMKSSILVEASVPGNYTCSATNSVGSTLKLILLADTASPEMSREPIIEVIEHRDREIDRQSRKVGSPFPPAAEIEYIYTSSAIAEKRGTLLLLVLLCVLRLCYRDRIYIN